MFADVFANFAEHACVRDSARSLTYAQTLALGRTLIAGLPHPKALVILRCSLTIESVAAYVALVVDGHVPLLLEDSLSDELLADLTAAYQPDAIVDPRRGVLALTGMPRVPLHPELALLLTTSGSTGSPKLVRLRASGLRSNAAAIAKYLELTAAERPLLHLPMSYSYGLSIINSHFIAGACVCLTRWSVMEPGYWNDLKAFEASSIAGVPFHYAALRRFGEAQLDLPHLTTLTQAGGRLDPKLTKWFADWAARTGRRFFVMYGQTEAGPRIAYLPPGAAASAPDSVGIAIDGVTIELQTEDGALVPDGTPGELVVRSAAVMLGYALSGRDLARGDEMNGVLRTGDVAVRGRDGLLRIVGRASRMLKIYGLRVNIDEVEARLTAQGHIALCFGEDDKLCVLMENVADTQAIRQSIVSLYSLPPRSIEVRLAAEPVTRSQAGKLTSTALMAAWEKATI